MAHTCTSGTQLIKGLVLVSTLTSSYLCHYNSPKFLTELKDATTERFASLTYSAFTLAFLLNAVFMVHTHALPDCIRIFCRIRNTCSIQNSRSTYPGASQECACVPACTYVCMHICVHAGDRLHDIRRHEQRADPQQLRHVRRPCYGSMPPCRPVYAWYNKHARTHARTHTHTHTHCRCMYVFSLSTYTSRPHAARLQRRFCSVFRLHSRASVAPFSKCSTSRCVCVCVCVCE